MYTKQPISLASLLRIVLISARLIWITDAANGHNFCEILITNNKGYPEYNNTLQSNGPFKRSEWTALPSNSSVSAVKVSTGCLLRICHFENGRGSVKSLKCQDVRKDLNNLTELNRWDKSKDSVLGLDCSCEVKKSCKNTWCRDKIITDKHQCATLFLDDNCSDCRFKPIPLKVGQPYNLNDNFSVISSLYVRPNCTVTADEGKDYHGETHNGFQFKPDRPAFTNQINKEMYGFSLFTCSCTDVKLDFPTFTSVPNSNHSNVLQIAILTVVGIIALSAVLSSTILLYKYKSKQKKLVFTIIKCVGEEHLIQHQDIVIDFDKSLGTGRFGKVYEGTWTTKDGRKQIVAIKQIRPSTNIESTNYMRSLTREIEVLKKIGPHPNVVTMFGASTYPTLQGYEVLLVLEVCEHSSLDKFLTKHKHTFLYNSPLTFRNNVSNYVRWGLENGSGNADQTFQDNSVDSRCLTPKKLVDWASQISSAMEHISSMKILHLDIQARNVLLDSKLNVKMCDYGLSKELFESYQYTKPPVKDPLPLHALAPEVIGNYIFTQKTDVWAFGVFLWELFSLGATPYSDLDFQNELELKKMLEDGYRLPQPFLCKAEALNPCAEAYEQMCSCWSQYPSERPEFVKLRQYFQLLFSKMSD